MPPPVLSNNTKQIMEDLGTSLIPQDIKMLFVSNFVNPVFSNINFEKEEHETLRKIIPTMEWFKTQLQNM